MNLLLAGLLGGEQGRMFLILVYAVQSPEVGGTDGNTPVSKTDGSELVVSKGAHLNQNIRGLKPEAKRVTTSKRRGEEVACVEE